MESNKEINKFLETKLKLLEIENQKLQANIEANNKEIEQINQLLKLSGNGSYSLSAPTPNPDDKIVNLNFNWKINDNAKITNDLKTVIKISGGNKWNCSTIGDKSLIKGKINKWKIQLTKMAGSIVFGIVPKGIDTSVNTIDNWKKGYVTCSCNFAMHNLGVWKEFKKYQASEGNIFEIIVDLNRGELSFSVNGNNFGIFCDNIIKDIEYLPFLDICEEQSEVTLI